MTARNKKLLALVPCTFVVLGLLLVFHTQLLSRLDLMQTGPDTRQLNYALEHNYRATLGLYQYAIWDPPQFYPERNTAAYTDTLLGQTPFYAVWRVLGVEADTSMQLMVLLFGVLNFSAFYVFLRRCLGTEVLASCFGAFLFAFGSVRTSMMGHFQLVPHFFTVGAVFALFRVFQRQAGEGNDSRPAIWIWLFWAFALLQFYAGFYLAWFLGFSVLVALLWAALLPSFRGALVEKVYEYRTHWIGGAIAASAGALPLALPYLEAARMFGVWDFEGIQEILPQVQSWVNMGPGSWLYNWLWQFEPIRTMPFEWEKRLGLGLVTSGMVLFGFWRERQRHSVLILVLTAVTLALVANRWPAGVTLWRGVYEMVPGAGAVRAVSRIGLLTVIPASIALALACQRLGRRWGVLAVIVVGGLCVLEQGQNLPSFAKGPQRERVRALAELIPRDCDAFYYSPYYSSAKPARSVLGSQLDAMWAGLIAGIPTVNGYSGHLPLEWALFDHGLSQGNQGKEEALDNALRTWLDAKNVGGKEVCWIKVATKEMSLVGIERIGGNPKGPTVTQPEQR